MSKVQPITEEQKLLTNIKDTRYNYNTAIKNQENIVKQIKQLALNNYSVQVIKDTTFKGKRITTLVVKYPRFIHAQFKTHRALSMNASSSRAIPVNKVIKNIKENTAIPLYWGTNQPGMQPGDQLSNSDLIDSFELWLEARDKAIDSAFLLNTIGSHKQIVNRILEPFALMETIVTATEWDNFFELRCDSNAQSEIQHLANNIKEAIRNSTPVECYYHIPFLTSLEEKSIHYNPNNEFSDPITIEIMANAYIESVAKDPLTVLPMDVAMAFSCARSARVSYINHGDTSINLKKDLMLFSALVGSDPIHASPTEHQAIHTSQSPYKGESNFRDWEQFRKFLE